MAATTRPAPAPTGTGPTTSVARPSVTRRTIRPETPSRVTTPAVQTGFPVLGSYPPGTSTRTRPVAESTASPRAWAARSTTPGPRPACRAQTTACETGGGLGATWTIASEWSGAVASADTRPSRLMTVGRVTQSQPPVLATPTPN